MDSFRREIFLKNDVLFYIRDKNIIGKSEYYREEWTLRFHNFALKTWNIYNVLSNFMEYSYVSSRGGGMHSEIITREFILDCLMMRAILRTKTS